MHRPLSNPHDKTWKSQKTWDPFFSFGYHHGKGMPPAAKTMRSLRGPMLTRAVTKHPHTRNATAAVGAMSGSSREAAAVPSACAAEPIVTPLTTGSFTRITLIILSPKLAPMMPCSTPLIAATDPLAPRACAMGRPIGRVIIRGTRPRPSFGGRAHRRAATRVNATERRDVIEEPPKMGSARCRRSAPCSNSPKPSATTAGEAWDRMMRPGPPGARYSASASSHGTPIAQPLRMRKRETRTAPETMGGKKSFALNGRDLPICIAVTLRATTPKVLSPSSSKHAPITHDSPARGHTDGAPRTFGSGT
mmetsp:Transcript_32700/g.80271  ORF Transcript_32700/g.80271 Transcript_32700/m.80271 type:complete len:306 (-) Transcript_32700:65-982(-)